MSSSMSTPSRKDCCPNEIVSGMTSIFSLSITSRGRSQVLSVTMRTLTLLDPDQVRIVRLSAVHGLDLAAELVADARGQRFGVRGGHALSVVQGCERCCAGADHPPGRRDDGIGDRF